MIDLIISGSIFAVYALLFWALHGLEKFVVKRSDREVSETIREFNETVVSKNIAEIRQTEQTTGGLIERFRDNANIPLALDNYRGYASSDGGQAYLLLIASAIVALIASILYSIKNPETQIHTYVGFAYFSGCVAIGLFVVFLRIAWDYLKDLKEIRKLVTDAEEITQRERIVIESERNNS